MIILTGTVHEDIFDRTEIKTILVQRWNSKTAFLVRVSGHKLKSNQTRVFVWFSNLVFPFYKMLFMYRLKFSCLAFFYRFKTRVLYGFLSVEGTVNSMEQKTRVLCENLCPRIPSQDAFL
jgi:hypothetical protein